MDVENLPLLELFTRLREAELPLGIDEYQLLLSALQAGFGISDRVSLKNLCRTLWVKSADDDRLFDYHFEQLVTQPSENESFSQALESLPELPEMSTDTSLPLPTLETDMPKTPLTTLTEGTGTSEMTIGAEDEVRVAQAVLQTASTVHESSPNRYILSDEYFPVTRRQMKQSWRYLRRPIREGPAVELDIETTIDEIGRQGILLEPILVPQRINRAELLLLIDHGGSMAPFHMLSQRLIETALRGGRLKKADIYYFHNYPVEYLYRDPTYQDYEQIEQICNGHYSQRAGILIFSDCGAARGGFNYERMEFTVQFLKQLKQYFRYIAWINPMPRSRWLGTTASRAMQLVPMFDLSRRGLDHAISVMRGHPPSLLGTLRHSDYE